MQWVLKFAKLSWGDRAFLCKTYILLTLVRLGLWLLPFESLYKRLEQLGHISQSAHCLNAPVNDQQLVQKIVWAVNVSCKLMPGTVKCLARALTTKVLLERRGCSCELKIGVAKNNAAQLEAHAWIEFQGYVIIGQLRDLDRFKPLPALPKSWQTGG
jgi:hypothetical protein